MILIAKIKLQPNPEQYSALLATLEASNQACNLLSSLAWEMKRFGRTPIHKVGYVAIRERFGLSAQLAVRCVAKVVAAYKSGNKRQRNFRQRGSIAYDSRILTYNLKQQIVSIRTLDKRLKIPFQAGEQQLEMLQKQAGESKLGYQQGSFYLYAPCEVVEAQLQTAADYIGVDLGIKNIAFDSDGLVHRGNHVNNARIRYRKLRAKLQSKGTRSAKPLLRKRRERESRFVNDVNHCISKQLVKKAQDTQRGLVLEDLQGIRERVTVNKSQRHLLHNWAFYDLQFKIRYKAKRAGVVVVFVNPAYTSQMCAECGYIDKRNRRSQSQFECQSCGHAAHADWNAAENIRRAAINQPNAAAGDS